LALSALTLLLLPPGSYLALLLSLTLLLLAAGSYLALLPPLVLLRSALLLPPWVPGLVVRHRRRRTRSPLLRSTLVRPLCLAADSGCDHRQREGSDAPHHACDTQRKGEAKEYAVRQRTLCRSRCC
jgi:hypothetical protein